MAFNSVSRVLPRIYGYLLAVASVALVTLVLFPLRENLSISTVGLLYLLPILLISTTIGLSGGLFCGLLSFLTFNYFFLIPYYTFTVHETQDLTALLVFFLVAVLISQLVGRAKENLRGLTIREAELVSLYELTLSLSGQNEPEAIAEALATHIWNTFHVEWVQVEFQTGGNQISYQVPSQAILPSAQAAQIIPLNSPRTTWAKSAFRVARQPSTPTKCAGCRRLPIKEPWLLNAPSC